MTTRFGEAWDLLKAPPIAHRGLWSPGGPPENSLAAFDGACAEGYGIELDVQLSADGEAMVFHDWSLERLTGANGPLAARSAADLRELSLGGTAEHIPTLEETLALVGGRALVLVELKTPPGAEGPLERRVQQIIARHPGPVAVIGFNPHSHAWFADHHPEVLRGLDSYSYAGAQGLSPEQRTSYARLEHVAVARPHFLALGLDMLPSAEAAQFRDAGMPVVAWTVRAPEQWAAVEGCCDNLIFEGFRP